MWIGTAPGLYDHGIVRTDLMEWIREYICFCIRSLSAAVPKRRVETCTILLA